MDYQKALLRKSRWRPWEFVIWVVAFALPAFVPSHALMINEIAIVGLFAMSLDLILGYTGIVSLGHAAFFGFGAYAAALFAKLVMPDPTIGLVVAIVLSALLGAVASVTILRGSDLTRLMVTLGTALLLLELANKLDWLTGGADGLQGVTMGPVLGLFEFDLYGRTAAWYSLGVMLVLFLLMRRLVHSPFGATLKAVRDNRLRAMAIGIPVVSRIAVIYTVAAAAAGAAGALLAQTTGFASLDVLAFDRSADVLLMLTIGGVGWLYGGVVGAIVFKLLQDTLSTVTPQYWMFWIGLILVLLVLIGRDRLFRPRSWFGARAGSEIVSDIVLSATGLVMRFGGITATNDVTLNLKRGARHALIGPNGAGKTTLINLLTGVLTPTAGRIELEGEDITRLAPHRRVARGMVRTFQINQLFDSMTPLETLALVVSQHSGLGAKWWRPLGSSRAVTEKAARLLEHFRLGDVAQQETRHLAYGKRRLLEIAIALACEPRVLLLDEPVAGVPAGEREELLQTVAALPADVSVLLIEHDMDLVFSFADRMTVLVNGTVLTEGDPDTIANDPKVKEVYLGQGAVHV